MEPSSNPPWRVLESPSSDGASPPPTTTTASPDGGLPATRVDLVKDLASCSGGADSPLHLFSTTSGGTSLSPGARGIVYVLEKDGELVVFIGVNYLATPSDEAELEGVIASTQFGP